MKRRNIDSAKMRRTIKKNRISEGFYSSGLVYLKILFVWAFVMMADFLLDFRFEFFWPSWLLLRSIYDSFRYQGIAFSVFFVCITVTSDLICFIFIPVQWLFFLASTYVWVQYVWHAGNKLCLIYFSLLVFEIKRYLSFFRSRCLPAYCYTLAAIRILRGFRAIKGAANVAIHIRSLSTVCCSLRKQKEVGRENEVYAQLLTEALPAELTSLSNDVAVGDAEKQHKFLPSSSEEIISNGAVCCNSNATTIFYNKGHNSSSSSTLYADGGGTAANRFTKNFMTSSASALPKNQRKFSNGYASSSLEQQNQQYSSLTASNGLYSEENDDYDVDDEALIDYVSTNNSTVVGWLSFLVAKMLGVSVDDKNTVDRAAATMTDSWAPPPSVEFGKEDDSDDDSRVSKDSRESSSFGFKAADEWQLSTKKTSATSMNGVKVQQKLKRRGASSPQFTATSTVVSPTKDVNNANQLSVQKEKVQDKDLCLSLESDIEKLKNELRSSRTREQDLRRQINDLVTSDKSVKNELQQNRLKNEQLESKLQNLVRARQQDKQTVTILEKRLCEEQKLKNQFEQQLQQEKKAQKKLEDAKQTVATTVVKSGDCTDACKSKRRDMEMQIKQVRRDLQQREEQFAQMDNEIRSLRLYKETNNVDVLMSALSAMQDKNQHLETSLSAETRIKLDLFSALGDTKRQLEIAHGQIMKKDHELDDLRRRMNNQYSGNVLFNNGPMGMCSPLTPPPSVPPMSTSLDGSSGSFEMVSSPSMYSGSGYMTSLNGVMYEDCGLMSPTEYGNSPFLNMMGVNNNVMPMNNMIDNTLLRFTPPRSSSNNN